MKILSPYFIVTISSLLSVNSSINIEIADHRSVYFSKIDTVNDSIALENDYVKVLRNASIASIADAGIFDKRILIALSDLTYKSQKKAYRINRGDVVVFQANDSYQQVIGDFFEVRLKKAHPLVKGPDQWIEPLKNTTVYEDEQLRIFQERLEPGDTRELHSHAKRVVIRLNQTQLTDPRFKPNSAPGEGIQVKNTV